MVDTLPDTIYHYTTLAGLVRILQTKQLMATDIKYMNDANEIIYANNEIVSRIDKRISKLKPLPPGSPYNGTDFEKLVLNDIAWLLERKSVSYDLVDHCYAACFSAKSDLLSQWRAYTGSDGYCIGFDAAELKNIKPKILDHRIDLVKVSYGSKEAKTGIKSILSTIGGGYFRHLLAAHSQYNTHILPTLAKIKNPAFKEEQEWRLMLLADDKKVDLNLREGRMGLIPYTYFNFDASALKKIIIGPGGDKELKNYALTKLIDKYFPGQSAGIDVSHTTASLRI